LSFENWLMNLMNNNPDESLPEQPNTMDATNKIPAGVRYSPSALMLIVTISNLCTLFLAQYVNDIWRVNITSDEILTMQAIQSDGTEYSYGTIV
jgi:hypothetical protein